MTDELIEVQKPHKLYVVKMSGSTGENFCKIGVTKRTIFDRFKEMFNYKIYETFQIQLPNGIIARGIESVILERVIPWDLKYKPKLHINGFTECYQPEIYDSIINTVNRLCYQQKFKIDDEALIDNYILDIQIEKSRITKMCENDVMVLDYDDETIL